MRGFRCLNNFYEGSFSMRRNKESQFYIQSHDSINKLKFQRMKCHYV